MKKKDKIIIHEEDDDELGDKCNFIMNIIYLFTFIIISALLLWVYHTANDSNIPVDAPQEF